MNFLITGATGTVGNILVNNLLNNQENIAVLMRNPDKKTFPGIVKKVQGDLSNVFAWKEIDGTKYPTEEALYQSRLNWTMLFPVEFMKNTLIFWQESIRTQHIARTPFPDAKGALIHEADIEEIAEIVLRNAGHKKKSYYLTGAEF